MKRILYIHGGADLYGASRSLLRIVTRLDRNRFEPHVLVPLDGPLCEALRQAGVSVTVMPSLSVITRRTLRSWRLALFMIRLPISVLTVASHIIRKKIDLVHTNVAIIVSAGLAARLAGAAHIWHLRERFQEFGRLWKWYSRYLLWASDVVPCVSTAIAKQFANAPDKVEVVFNGLPLDEFEGVSEERVAAFREKYGFSGRRTVGVVGRIKFQRKGQEVFARAAALLKEKFNDVRFAVIGSPFPGNEEHLEKLKALIRSLDIGRELVLTGDVEDIKAALKSLDVLVLPSVDPEPFAGVVIEAMTFGVPVIATRVGGSTEQIEDGISGLLVEPNNPQMLAQAIERLLTDQALAGSIRATARARVEECFSFEVMWEKLEHLYEQSLGIGTEGRLESAAAGNR